ncbi:MAG TPA: peptide chain release factor N(5)-glutamine methyltransferase [Candidatus Limnocylindria bacterium]|nr:peptide chain release factor N(5)-glutamine methyltransferase [Candidatus Limnocylindria bacterium]
MARSDLQPPTVAAAVTDAAERLRSAGVPTPRLDAELLVAHLFDRERTWLHAHPEVAVAPDDAALLDGWVARRGAGEPVAYIRGYKEWFSLRVATDRRALIPRPETELLAEAAIAEIAARLVRDHEPIVAWDVATGSGAVALALALRFRTALRLGRLRLVASDVSPDALELASENLAVHGVSGVVSLAGGDLLEPVSELSVVPDVLSANLPYVRSDEVERAEGSLAYEPRAALDGGPDGLDVVRRLVAQLPERLAAASVALLEVGAGQAEATRALVAALPMRSVVTILPDLAGIDRVVRVARL